MTTINKQSKNLTHHLNIKESKIKSANSFREKNTKYATYLNSNKNNNINTTLDNKHLEKVAEFNSSNDNLHKKKKKIKKT